MVTNSDGKHKGVEFPSFVCIIRIYSYIYNIYIYTISVIAFILRLSHVYIMAYRAAFAEHDLQNVSGTCDSSKVSPYNWSLSHLDTYDIYSFKLNLFSTQRCNSQTFQSRTNWLI